MLFELRSTNMNYEDGKIKDVNVTYKAGEQNSDSNINITGEFKMTHDEYEGNEAIETLEDLSKEDFLGKIDDLPLQIRSANMVYEGNEIKRVDVICRGKLDDRSLSVSGDLNLDTEIYNNNSSVDKLQEVIKDMLKEKATD